MSLRTYLNFGGNCADAFKFYEQNLGAKINMLMTFDQMPGPAEMPSGSGREGSACQHRHRRHNGAG